MDKEIGTLKKWIEVIILALIVIAVTIYLCSWYNTYKSEKMNDFVLNDIVKQIKYEELDPYLQENTDAYVYICVVNDNDCREFEEDIKSDLENSTFKDYMVYLNLTDEKDKKAIIKDINKKYGDKKQIDNYPAFVHIKDLKIVSMVSKTNKKLTRKDFMKYLDVNEML